LTKLVLISFADSIEVEVDTGAGVVAPTLGELNAESVKNTTNTDKTDTTFLSKALSSCLIFPQNYLRHTFNMARVDRIDVCLICLFGKHVHGPFITIECHYNIIYKTIHHHEQDKQNYYLFD
jgi:hypothetical protein